MWRSASKTHLPVDNVSLVSHAWNLQAAGAEADVASRWQCSTEKNLPGTRVLIS